MSKQACADAEKSNASPPRGQGFTATLSLHGTTIDRVAGICYGHRQMPDHTLGILALEGDIDLYQTPVVKVKLDELIDLKTERILVDLGRVNYMDSSGLALFIECLQRIGSYGGKLGLFALQPSVRHIFEIARLDQVLHLYPDEKTARASL